MVTLTNTTTATISMRLPTEKLAAIDSWCASHGDRRAKFISRSAYKQARRIVNGKLPYYEEATSAPLRDKTTAMSVVVISLRGDYLALVEKACKMLRHKLSLFIVWSALAELRHYEEVGPDQLSLSI